MSDLTADRLGLSALLFFGWTFVGHGLGSAPTTYSTGFGSSVYATYMYAFHDVAGLLCLIATLGIFAIRTRRGRASPVAAYPAPHLISIRKE